MNNKIPFVVVALSLAISVGCKDIVDNLDDDSKEQITQSFSDLFNDFSEDESESIDTSEALASDYIVDEEAEFAIGEAKLAGVVGVSQITPKTLAKIASKNGVTSYDGLRAKAAEALTQSNFVVYWMDGKGNKNPINMSDLEVEIYIPSGADPQFIITGVTDGLNYIVEISVQDSTGVVTTLTNIAYVPLGETQATIIEITPTTTVKTEVVVQKVKSSYFETGGDLLSQNFIEDLNDTLTVVIEEVINDPDSNFDLASFAAAADNQELLDQLVAAIITDDRIVEKIEIVENAAVSESYEVDDVASSSDEGRAVMEELFAQLIQDGDGGAPQFFIDYFGDQYAAGATKTVSDVLGAVYQGLSFQNPEMATQLSLSNALAAFSAELANIYARIDAIAALESSVNQLTAEEQVELTRLRVEMADVPSVLMGIFPPGERVKWTSLTGTSAINVPQAITITIYVIETYLADLISYERDTNGEINQDRGYDFNPEHLLAIYGWMDFDSGFDISLYEGLSVQHLEIHPDIYWDNVSGTEKDVLSAWACYETVGDNFDVTAVTLTYPTTASTADNLVTASIALTNNEGDSCWGLDPWRAGEELAQEFKADDVNGDFVNWDLVWAQLETDGKIVTDFTSGPYTITVNYNTDQVEIAVFEKRLILGLNNLRPVLTSPLAEPQYPDNGASEADWAAFNELQANYTMSAFAPGTVIEIAWDEPNFDNLPEGVVPVYQLDIGHEVCYEQSDATGMMGCNWEHVYTTWDEDVRIFGNRFVVPVDLAAQELTERPYHVSVNVNFIDGNTGEFLGSGGHSNAPFRVGDPLDLTGTFSLTGVVNNLPVSGADQYKVAIVEEMCTEDENFQWSCSTTTLAVSAIDSVGGYTLTPTINDLMKRTNDSWVEVRVFLDEQMEGEVGFNVLDADQEAGVFEQMWWPTDNVWFNVWGGLLHVESEACEMINPDGTVSEPPLVGAQYHCNYSSEIVLPGVTVTGPTFDVSQEVYEPGAEQDGPTMENIYLNSFSEMPTYAKSDFEGDHIELNVSTDPTFSWVIDPNMPEIPDFYRLMVFKVSFEFLQNTNSNIEAFVIEAFFTETEAMSVTFSSATNLALDVLPNSPFPNATELMAFDESGFYIWKVEGMKYPGDTGTATDTGTSTDIGTEPNFVMGPYPVGESRTMDFFPGNLLAIEQYLPLQAEECIDESGIVVACEDFTQQP
ncbi:MAG: hypothetical protein HRU38_08250 [Saccharospirillaceae bacterium]|nr:hypothetical protein [Pseudomonadales bacterium]NRB78645.1 hypothetical protein [Saccharospirillaceae bacterium]